MITPRINGDGLTLTKLSSIQELVCWLATGSTAVALWLLSHTFYVTTATYSYGLVLLSLVVFMFWFKSRTRANSRPKWLRLVSNGVLVELSAVFLLYLIGVATWYE